MTRPTAPPSGDLDWQDGQPLSRRFGDVYFARASGIEETRHVFLAGNGLPDRWAGLAPKACFVVGETGFGTGLNFACAWALWDEVAPPDAQLHFVSVERYPLAQEELARALALWPALAGQRTALVDAWEAFAPGWHRLAFAGGRVTLTLLVGDVATVLPRLDATVDAWFLDGFAPARNPAMWTPEVFAQVARLARAGATFATYTVAGDVRRGLEAAGFDVHKAAGFGHKREMLRGTRDARVAATWRPPWFARPAPARERRAIVIGAGLAGAATAGSLSARGWEVTVVDRHAVVAAEASGNHQGVLYAHLSPHPTVLNELVLSGLQHSGRVLRRVLDDRPDAFSACGVLQLAFDQSEDTRHARLAALGLPLLERLGRDEASERAGIALPHGGLLFPRAGWAHPPALCAALLADAGVRLALGTGAVELARTPDAWTVHVGDRVVAAAPTVVIAAAGGTASFGATAHLPLRTIRGQTTLVPETARSRALRAVVCGEGYVAPARDGLHSLGATHRVRDTGVDVRPEENAENLARLHALAPAIHAALDADRLDPAALGARAGLRCSSPDYLPIVGPVVDAAAFASVYARLAHDAALALDAPSPWLDGLYVSTAHGSRGLITPLIAGELLAACLENEPAPLPSPVVEAVHPSRFLLRALIRRRLPPR